MAYMKTSVIMGEDVSCSTCISNEHPHYSSAKHATTEAFDTTAAYLAAQTAAGLQVIDLKLPGSKPITVHAIRDDERLPAELLGQDVPHCS